jgi:uncharacterized damage-inducible protein DinB
MPGDLLVMLYEHNRWANDRLLDRCRQLDDEQLGWSSEGTYGSIRDTLVHLFAAQERYVEVLTGAESGEVDESKGYPGLEALRHSGARTGAALVEFARADPPDHKVERRRRGQVEMVDLSTVAIQAINHATEHRAHINTILGQKAAEPPPLDGWAFGRAR